MLVLLFKGWRERMICQGIRGGKGWQSQLETFYRSDKVPDVRREVLQREVCGDHPVGYVYYLTYVQV